MDMSLETWVDIIVVVTVVSGGIVLWGISPRKKKVRLVKDARERPRE